MSRRNLFLILELCAAVLLVLAVLTAEPRQRGLAIDTLLLCGGVVAMSLPPGVFLAVLIARTDLPGRRVWACLLRMQLFLPLFLQASAWQSGFGLQGWYHQIFGGNRSPLLFGWRGALWVHSMAAIPWITLIVSSGLRIVEPQLEEDARLDASPWRVVSRVTLPRAMSAISLAALWTAIVVAGEMTITDVYQVRTYAEEVYTQFTVESDASNAQLASLPGMAILGCLLTAMLSQWSRLLPEDALPPYRPAFDFRLGRWRWPLALLATGLVVLIVGVPTANLIIMAGKTVINGPSGLERHFSLPQALNRIFTAPVRQSQEFIGSLQIGLLVATVSTLLAAAIGWTARRGGWLAVMAMLLAVCCLVTPGAMLGIVLIRIFNDPAWPMLNRLYDNPVAMPCIVQTARAFPLALLMLWMAARGVPRNLLELAALDGAGKLRQVLHVAWPLRWPAVVAAWLLSLIVALGELPGTLVVHNAGVKTLAIDINQKLHYGINDRPAGMCLFVELVFFMLVAALGLIARWSSASGVANSQGRRNR